MVFNKNITALGGFENTFAGKDGNTVRVFWYEGGVINTLTMPPSCEGILAGPQSTVLSYDQYAFGPDCVIAFEDGVYKVQAR